jgi:hypothetical protein
MASSTSLCVSDYDAWDFTETNHLERSSFANYSDCSSFDNGGMENHFADRIPRRSEPKKVFWNVKLN